MDATTDIYRRLQQHLDKMPVRFPATQSGVELRLLKKLFTTDQARIALGLDYKLRTVQQIHEHLGDMAISARELETKLEEMVDKGNTFTKKQDGVKFYANLPLAVGMWELQVNRLTPELLLDADEYFRGEFGHAYVSTQVSQMRIIPVRKSITVEHRISTYDELRDIIERAEGRIRVGECICRKSMQMAGHTCKVTARRETCMGFRDLGDAMARTGWGRPVSKEEALEIAAKNEEDGLVLEAGNEQDVQFICSCCGDCCGALKGVKALPRPAEFVASNYYAQVDAGLCNGCGACVDRCQMDAVAVRDDIAAVNQDRCIGCGLCVSTCPPGSIRLTKKEAEQVPPKNLEALFEAIMEGRQTGQA